MRKNISIWQMCGFGFTAVGGMFLHFLYDWTGNSQFAALFSGVNESTWEHMKLLFWPMFIFAILQSFFFKDFKNFWCVKLRGILLSLVLIPVIFYTYNGVIGKSPDWVNVDSFFVAAAIGYIYELRLFNKKNTKCKFPRLAFATLCVLAGMFMLFTFVTPKLGVFLDPLTGTYGING